MCDKQFSSGFMRGLLIALWIVCGSIALAPQALSQVATVAVGRVRLHPLAENVWVHESAQFYAGRPFPSNGLVIRVGDSVLLVDTPWGEGPTVDLLRQLDSMGLHVQLCISTHAHEDRVGGLRTLQARSIRCLGSRLTEALAVKNGHPQFDGYVENGLGPYADILKVLMPGAAHAPDNICVYVPAQRILFGGCMVRPLEATDMGNTADADLLHWPEAIRFLQHTVPAVCTVVPGHGRIGDAELLQHTLDLLRQHGQRK